MYVSLPEGKHPRWNFGQQWTRSGGGKLMMCNILVTKKLKTCQTIYSEYAYTYLWYALVIHHLLVWQGLKACPSKSGAFVGFFMALCLLRKPWQLPEEDRLPRCLSECFLVGDVICLWAISSLEIGPCFPMWDFHHREVARPGSASQSSIAIVWVAVDCRLVNHQAQKPVVKCLSWSWQSL